MCRTPGYPCISTNQILVMQPAWLGQVFRPSGTQSHAWIQLTCCMMEICRFSVNLGYGSDLDGSRKAP